MLYLCNVGLNISRLLSVLDYGVNKIVFITCASAEGILSKCGTVINCHNTWRINFRLIDFVCDRLNIGWLFAHSCSLDHQNGTRNLPASLMTFIQAIKLKSYLCVANPILQTCGGKKDPSYISAAIQDRDKILTATVPFSLTAISMELLMKMPDATGRGNSKMAAF